MNKKIRNLFIALAAFGAALIIITACAAPAFSPSIPPPSTISPANTASPQFQVRDLHMTNTRIPITPANPSTPTNPCDYPVSSGFGNGQPVFVTWKEFGDRRGESLTIHIVNKSTGQPVHSITVNPTPNAPTNRCDIRQIPVQLPKGSYQTLVDPRFGVTPIEWSIQ